MTDRHDNVLSPSQAAVLERILHDGAAQAASALSRWLGKPATIEVDSVEQLPLERAAIVLGSGEDPICICEARMEGLVHPLRRAAEHVLHVLDPFRQFIRLGGKAVRESGQDIEALLDKFGGGLATDGLDAPRSGSNGRFGDNLQ